MNHLRDVKKQKFTGRVGRHQNQVFAGKTRAIPRMKLGGVRPHFTFYHMKPYASAGGYHVPHRVPMMNERGVHMDVTVDGQGSIPPVRGGDQLQNPEPVRVGKEFFPG